MALAAVSLVGIRHPWYCRHLEVVRFDFDIQSVRPDVEVGPRPNRNCPGFHLETLFPGPICFRRADPGHRSWIGDEQWTSHQTWTFLSSRNHAAGLAVEAG